MGDGAATSHQNEVCDFAGRFTRVKVANSRNNTFDSFFESLLRWLLLFKREECNFLIVNSFVELSYF